MTVDGLNSLLRKWHLASAILQLWPYHIVSRYMRGPRPTHTCVQIYKPVCRKLCLSRLGLSCRCDIYSRVQRLVRSWPTSLGLCGLLDAMPCYVMWHRRNALFTRIIIPTCDLSVLQLYISEADTDEVIQEDRWIFYLTWSSGLMLNRIQ